MYAVLMLPSDVLITNHFVLMYIVHVHVWCTYLSHILLLSNQNFKGPYLEAEVVEEVIGWLVSRHRNS